MAEQRYEFQRAVIGMVRLAQLDFSAVDLFGKTPRAALRSMRFLFLCIPVVMLMVWPESKFYVEKTGYDALSYAVLAATQMLISALGFLLVMAHLTARLGVRQNFAHYVTTECYVALPVALVIALLTGLWTAAGVTDDGKQLLEVLVYAAQIIIDWAITYATLKVKPVAAFAICIMGVLFNKVVQLMMALLLFLSIPALSQIVQP